MSAPTWSLREREAALGRAERDGLDLLVVGGGITGAGVLRDAASRGMRTLLVERDDFASGTSSRSSKMVHGGLRYIAEGQLGLTREACRERDLLMAQHPHLVRPMPFLFPSYRGGRYPLWQVRAALTIYAALANFRRSARFRILRPDAVAEVSRDLRRDGLVGAGLYVDGQVDDARLVLETLRSARSLGGEAVNYAELVEFVRDADGSVRGARVRDAISGAARTLHAHAVVNAAGPNAERLRGLDRPLRDRELRPAKGVHLVIPRERVHAEAVVTFEAPDGRQLFLVPWDEVSLLGTTDAFSEETDEPVVSIDEVHYLLSAANDAFPSAALTTNDVRCAFAGVRPLAASLSDETPSGKVSREHRVIEDPSGLVSVVGGKLTTYRATAERVVDRILGRFSRERRGALNGSRTATLPLRDERFDGDALRRELEGSFGLTPARADHLVRTHGRDAERVLREAPAELRRPIGATRFTFAEIPWSFGRECPWTLCDLLERRMRVAIFAIGQGLGDLEEIARVAGDAAGWDEERIRAEKQGYLAAVRARYQIAPPRVSGTARAA